ncbi:MAG: 4a-hydroxytetrahydrobiopterin dehydratase [Patescibacteria group bacterium]|nr:4a-hydroxytetrahydrobiopterin dehydratase [Patescibacteria group bacterium]
MLSDLNNWELVEDGKVIKKTLVLKDFKEALGFVNRVGELAEAHDHHPDIKLFDYKKVEISLTTHSAGGLTEKDVVLAKEIDKLSV